MEKHQNTRTYLCLEQVKLNLQNGVKPEVYLQFDLLEQYPQLMEPGGLRSDTFNWNMTPRLYKRTLGLPTLIVNLRVWTKWCEESCAQWEPDQLARNFQPGVALAICQTLYHDHPNEKLWEQMVISMALVYIPEHWHLASFMETSFMINAAKEEKDTQGMISLTRLHKKAQFYSYVSYLEYKQHMTVVPLTPLDEERLGLCGRVEDFTVGALHR